MRMSMIYVGIYTWSNKYNILFLCPRCIENIEEDIFHFINRTCLEGMQTG